MVSELLAAAGDGSEEGHEPGMERCARRPGGPPSQAEETGGLGRLGRPMDRRSPFFIGMTARPAWRSPTALVELIIRARSVLVLIGLALFIAAGLDPVVTWLTKHRVPRWAAVMVVLAGRARGDRRVPGRRRSRRWRADANADRRSFRTTCTRCRITTPHLGRLNVKFHVEQRLTHLLASRGSSLVGGVLGAGALVLSALASTLAVIVLVIYFLAGMPRIKLFVYRLAPHSRRARVILIGDEIFTKVGGFVLGNVVTSVIAGLGTYLWMLAFGIPYPILLGLFVALWT